MLFDSHFWMWHQEREQQQKQMVNDVTTIWMRQMSGSSSRQIGGIETGEPSREWDPAKKANAAFHLTCLINFKPHSLHNTATGVDKYHRRRVWIEYFGIGCVSIIYFLLVCLARCFYIWFVSFFVFFGSLFASTLFHRILGFAPQCDRPAAVLCAYCMSYPEMFNWILFGSRFGPYPWGEMHSYVGQM